MHVDWLDLSIGDLIAAVAVLVAMYQLARSTRDLQTDRRVDFQLTQFVEIAESLDDHFGRAPSARIAARVRLLPAARLPRLREWVDAGDAGVRPVMDRYVAEGATGDVVTWLKQLGMLEIDEAVRDLLKDRSSKRTLIMNHIRRLAKFRTLSGAVAASESRDQTAALSPSEGSGGKSGARHADGNYVRSSGGRA